MKSRDLTVGLQTMQNFFLGDDYDAKIMKNSTILLKYGSTVVQHIVLFGKKKRFEIWPADMYLEGSDQHRGWCSSLLDLVELEAKHH